MDLYLNLPEVIKRVLRTYSYSISDQCLETLVSEIENYHAIKRDYEDFVNGGC